MDLRLRSFAKINLHLQVVGRRGDGYHELRTVFQSIDLADEIALGLTRRPGIALTVLGADLAADSTNLAWRAAERILAERAPGRGVEIELVKKIPLGGGLAGGSANAATILYGIDRLLGGGLAAERRWELARELGADVPYCLLGGTALGSGRGDEVVPLVELPATRLVLAIPPVTVSTREVFGSLAPAAWPPLAPAVAALGAGWAPKVEIGTFVPLANDLEAPVLARYPQVAATHAALVAAGADLVRLSGSGATVWAWFASGAPADLSSRLPAATRCVATTTLSRAARERLQTLDPRPGETV